jgi:hypothetical protein
MAKALPFGKTFFLQGSTSPSWLNFYRMAKPFHFMAKLLLHCKTILLHG